MRYKDKVFEKNQCDSIAYTIIDGKSLMMDIYQSTGDTARQRPLVILAHGGSFMHGNRKRDSQVPLCTELAKRGYVAVSIEYRLTNLIGMATKKNAYKNILKAVADGRASIQWFLNNAGHGNTYRIDTNNIFFGGASAGAILAEQLVFLDSPTRGNRTLRKAIQRYLPDSTMHTAHAVRGIISLAGAVFDTSIIKVGGPAILHIQGDADHVVQYGYKHALYGFAPLKMAGLGACRSIYAAKKLSFSEYTFKGKGHTTWDTNAADLEIVKAHVVEFLLKEVR